MCLVWVYIYLSAATLNSVNEWSSFTVIQQENQTKIDKKKYERTLVCINILLYSNFVTTVVMFYNLKELCNI